jgi:signal peptidase II
MTQAIPDPEQPTTRSIPPSRFLLFWAIALAGAGFDLSTKAYVFNWIGPPHQRPPFTIIKNVLELQTSYNTGALWGFMRGVPHSSLIFAGLSIVAAIGICYWLFALGAAADRRLTIALALIMAGALGNCYDRLLLGHVRDFVHLQIEAINFDCAIFNFADNMLVVGAVALVLLALRPDVREGGETSQAEPAPSV